MKTYNALSIKHGQTQIDESQRSYISLASYSKYLVASISGIWIKLDIEESIV